ncbi:MAG: hypothetical protein ABUJ93_08820 [Hyphomicrobium sp.]
MTKAASIDTTSPDFFSRGWQEACEAIGSEPSEAAETKREDVIDSAVARSEEIWAMPVHSWEGVAERAKVAFYWNADGIDEDGSPTLADLQSGYYDKRSAAELIAAVLALNKK